MDYFDKVLELVKFKQFDIAIPLMESVGISAKDFIENFIKIAYPTELNFENFTITNPQFFRQYHNGKKIRGYKKYEQALYGIYGVFYFSLYCGGAHSNKNCDFSLYITPKMQLDFMSGFEKRICISVNNVNNKITRRINKEFYKELERIKNDLTKCFEKLKNKFG